MQRAGSHQARGQGDSAPATRADDAFGLLQIASPRRQTFNPAAQSSAVRPPWAIRCRGPSPLPPDRCASRFRYRARPCPSCEAGSVPHRIAGPASVRRRFLQCRHGAATRLNSPASIMLRNSRTVMLQSQSSMTTLSNFDQPAGSISRRASETKVAPGLTQCSRLTISVDVVPPMARSERLTTSSIVSSGRTGIWSFSDHLRANASRVSGRRDVQTISSKR